MSERNFVICDPEVDFANAFAENLLERRELNINIYIFSCWNRVLEFAKTHRIHILVVDERVEEYQEEMIFVEAQFVWVREETEKENAIYKYQCADWMIEKIFEVYAEIIEGSIFKQQGKGRTRVEAIYSPVRGIGKSRFAIALGREMARESKVLYLNMEEYPGFEESGADESPLNLGDLLYFMRQNVDCLGLRVKSAVRKMGNLDYIPPIYLAQDLKEVKKEEWLRFLQELCKLGFYDVILLDLGECVEGLLQILQGCDCIYTPTVEHEVARQKLYRYEQCLERMHLEKIVRNTQQFVLPEDVEDYVKRRVREVR